VTIQTTKCVLNYANYRQQSSVNSTSTWDYCQSDTKMPLTPCRCAQTFSYLLLLKHSGIMTV